MRLTSRLAAADWRITFHGTGGVLVSQSTSPAQVEIWSNSSDEKMTIPASKSVDSLEGLTGQSYLDVSAATPFASSFDPYKTLLRSQ